MSLREWKLARFFLRNINSKDKQTGEQDVLRIENKGKSLVRDRQDDHSDKSGRPKLPHAETNPTAWLLSFHYLFYDCRFTT